MGLDEEVAEREVLAGVLRAGLGQCGAERAERVVGAWARGRRTARPEV